MNDEHLVTLYLDGELDQEEAEELEGRLEREPELMALLEEQLSLSALVSEVAHHESERRNLEGFTARVMAALPDEVHAVKRAPARSAPVQEEPRGVVAWLASQLTPLLIGAAVAAAILLSLRGAEVPSSTRSGAGSTGTPTVLINLDKAKEDGAAPVIWVLDEEEERGGAEGGEDDPI
jgi:negative regulator of sigma E activity